MRALRRVVVGLLVAVVVLGGLVAGVVVLYTYNKAPLPVQDQCVSRVADLSVPLNTQQARNASIIAGVATQRGLVPRATTIGLATAYQESGLINLDYGDRDSLGLFQQRPSQGWGTPEQVMDPWYAANAFYAVLVEVDGWQTGDVNDVAQAVQRSGHPNGYARHVENARRVASSLTGETPASFSCVVRTPPAPDPGGLEDFLRDTLPEDVGITRFADRVEIDAGSSQGAWSAAHITVANTAWYGLSRVEVGGRSLELSTTSLATWSGEQSNATTVVVWFDTVPTPSR